MFKNYIRIAFRNIIRNKVISSINLLGLAIGLAVCLMILLFVKNEWSYDRYNSKADRTVRVFFEGRIQGEALKEANVMPPVAGTLLDEFAEVEEAARLRVAGTPRINYQNESFNTHEVAFVDNSFFSVFDLPWIGGNKATALVEPNTVVISKLVAQKYFGNTNPIGESLFFKDWNESFEVTGLIEEVPENSHFHFDIFTSMAGMPDAKVPSWMVSEFYTYLVLSDGYDYRNLEAKLPAIFEKYAGPQLQKAMGITLEDFVGQGNHLALKLQPLTDIHLRSDFAFDLAPHGNINYVYIFMAIALFMLLIACINFMNLSTASASKRAKEVGVRKAVGSGKGDLIEQFLLESILMASVGLLIAIFLVKISLPYFNEIANKNLSFRLFENPWLIPSLLLVALVTGILAGSYPAFFLSSLRPDKVLKGNFRSGKQSGRMRSGLVVFQFFLTITLITSTLVVYQQLQFIQNTKLGFDTDSILVVPDLWSLKEKESAFRQFIEDDTRVVSASYSGYLPVGSSYNNNFFLNPLDNNAKSIKTLRYDVDENYIPTLNIEILEGRNFSKQFSTDSTAIILNEAAVKAFDWQDNALGQGLTYSNNEGQKTTYQVVGVVKDFHFKSLHEKISPLVMVLGGNNGAAVMKVNTPDLANLLADLKRNWDELSPDVAFNPSFFDDRIYTTYQAERRVSTLLNIFSSLTIFVACLGLFGLTVFTTERRKKEISVRKVLGATITNIVTLLSKDFLRLVIIAFTLAIPVAWYLMQNWLTDFAYRIELRWWFFALAGIMAIGIAFLTVSFQSFKAAIVNPADSLKNE